MGYLLSIVKNKREKERGKRERDNKKHEKIVT